MRFANLLIICFISTCILSCRGKGTPSSYVCPIKGTLEGVSNSISKDCLTFSDTISHSEKNIENYSVKYSLRTNDIIADTIYVSDTDCEIFYNRSLFLTVHYNNKLIVDDYEVKSISFSGIDNPERFQLAPMGSVDIKSVNDTLLVSTGMFVVDTDWGYFLTIKISKTGDVFLYADDADDYYSDEVE